MAPGERDTHEDLRILKIEKAGEVISLKFEFACALDHHFLDQTFLKLNNMKKPSKMTFSASATFSSFMPSKDSRTIKFQCLKKVKKSTL